MMKIMFQPVRVEVPGFGRSSWQVKLKLTNELIKTIGAWLQASVLQGHKLWCDDIQYKLEDFVHFGCVQAVVWRCLGGFSSLSFMPFDQRKRQAASLHTHLERVI